MSPSTEKPDAGRSASSGALMKRVLSAAILMPVVTYIIYRGGPAFAAMIAFASVVMLFEWTRMVQRRAFGPAFSALVAGAAGAMFAAAAGSYQWAISMACIGGLCAGWLVRRDSGIGVWAAMGALYIIIPCIALVWLRLDAPSGRALSVMLFGVVWAADSGAFLFGKLIGGPRISHALSPSKTWAGICGGVAGGCMWGVLWGSVAFGPPAAILCFFVGGCLGAASVLGDLFESGVKRYFGLKDISGLIPGHGGALDRLDGMIFATSAMTGGLLLYMLAEKLQG